MRQAWVDVTLALEKSSIYMTGRKINVLLE
jgi:hypothetical protein